MDIDFRILFAILLVLLALFGDEVSAVKRKESNTLSLGEKVQQMLDWNIRRPVIKLNTDTFKSHVRSQPRNYTVVVMLTATNPGRGCGICKQALEEYEIVANSWRYSQINSGRLFFALVDYDDGQDIFNALKISTAPVFLVFPSNRNLRSSDKLDVERVGFSAEAISKWIAETTDIHIRVFRPPNYSGSLALILLLAFVSGLLYLKRSNLDFVYNSTVWATLALCVVFAMTSGQMWNHIRSPPLVHRNPQTGALGYIHGSSQGQFIFESYIVIFLNAAVTFGLILVMEAGSNTDVVSSAVAGGLGETGPDGQPDSAKQRTTAYIGMGIMAVFFSLLLSVFRSKYQGYPYSFLFR